jgi:hypothetical protein
MKLEESSKFLPFNKDSDSSYSSSLTDDEPNPIDKLVNIEENLPYVEVNRDNQHFTNPYVTYISG